MLKLFKFAIIALVLYLAVIYVSETKTKLPYQAELAKIAHDAIQHAEMVISAKPKT